MTVVNESCTIRLLLRLPGPGSDHLKLPAVTRRHHATLPCASLLVLKGFVPFKSPLWYHLLSVDVSGLWPS